MQQRAGAPGQRASGAGGFHAARVALEQGHVQHALEFGQSLGQGGGRDMLAGRGRRDAAFFQHRQEDLQGVEIKTKVHAGFRDISAREDSGCPARHG
ncbi:hypothetical protein D9M69_598400 [compost metagenome]